MTELVKFARPYAKAVFEFAQEHQQLDQWETLLNTMSALVREPQVAEILKNPKYTEENRCEVCTDLSTSVLKTDAHRNFIQLLARNGRLNVLPEIAKAYKQLRASAEKIVTIGIKSAASLSESYREDLHTLLSKKLHREVVLDYTVDPTLLSGLLVSAQTENKVIDTTVRSQLNRLREALLY